MTREEYEKASKTALEFREYEMKMGQFEEYDCGSIAWGCHPRRGEAFPVVQVRYEPRGGLPTPAFEARRAEIVAAVQRWMQGEGEWPKSTQTKPPSADFALAI